MLAPMRLHALFSVGVFALAACGDDGGSTPPIDSASGSDSQAGSDAAIDTPSGTFTLTSTAYAEGGVIPLAHVCAGQDGMNQSPPLAWTNPPAGTMSFAIVFTDIFDPQQPFIHSVIYDIPATATNVPGNISRVYAPPDVAGAHQTNAYDGQRGYAGPCPGEMHTYEQAIYALPTATLTGAMMNTNRTTATNLIKANNLGVAKLNGTHTPPPP
jgi:Raf kinase inhibitor-like YbhB/YbcL family protein